MATIMLVGRSRRLEHGWRRCERVVVGDACKTKDGAAAADCEPDRPDAGGCEYGASITRSATASPRDGCNSCAATRAGRWHVRCAPARSRSAAGIRAATPTSSVACQPPRAATPPPEAARRGRRPARSSMLRCAAATARPMATPVLPRAPEHRSRAPESAQTRARAATTTVCTTRAETAFLPLTAATLAAAATTARSDARRSAAHPRIPAGVWPARLARPTSSSAIIRSRHSAAPPIAPACARTSPRPAPTSTRRSAAAMTRPMGTHAKRPPRSVSIVTRASASPESTARLHTRRRQFPVGASALLPDDDQCKCEGGDLWLSTLRACDLPKVEACDGPSESSPGLQVTPIYRANDSLALSVQYGGGCFEHTFKLCYSEAFAESSPVQTRLWLIDESTQVDSCLALLTRELVFDLSPIRERYVSQYPGGPNTVRLNLSEHARLLFLTRPRRQKIRQGHRASRLGALALLNAGMPSSARMWLRRIVLVGSARCRRTCASFVVLGAPGQRLHGQARHRTREGVKRAAEAAKPSSRRGPVGCSAVRCSSSGASSTVRALDPRAPAADQRPRRSHRAAHCERAARRRSADKNGMLSGVVVAASDFTGCASGPRRLIASRSRTAARATTITATGGDTLELGTTTVRLSTMIGRPTPPRAAEGEKLKIT